MKNKKNYNYPLILFILVLLSYLFNTINIELYNNATVSIGVVLYSLTFLVSSIMIERNKIKECKKYVLSSVKYMILFFGLVTIMCQFDSSNELINSIKNVFTQNTYTINNYSLYYPNVYKLIVYLIVYYFSHYIFFVTYEVSYENVGYLISFLLSILISFILDQMLFTTIYNIPYLFTEKIIVNDFLNILTSNFIVTLLSSIILLLFVPIFNKSSKD